MNYEIYKPYEDLMEKVIRNEKSLHWIMSADIRIGVLKSYKEKKKAGKLVFGECVKVNELYSPFCPYDFLIIIYEDNIRGLTDMQLYILMHHELLHVGMEEKNGEPKYRTIPHDVEDFEEIIERYGLHWDRPGYTPPEGAAKGGG